MAELRQPLVNIVYNDETGRYIGMLERKLLIMTQNEIRFRALLELLTDEDWDDYQFKAEDEEIRDLAIDALKRRLGLSDEDARKLVADRWAAHNPDPAPDSTKTYLIGQSPNAPPHMVHQARPPVANAGEGPAVQPDPGYDVQKHLQGIAQAKARQSQAVGRREIK